MAILCGSNTQVQQRATPTECTSVLVLTARHRKGHYQPLRQTSSSCWLAWMLYALRGSWKCWHFHLHASVVVMRCGGNWRGCHGIVLPHPTNPTPPANFTVCSPTASSSLLMINLTVFITRVLFDAKKKCFVFIWWHFNKVTVAESEGILT